jgi:NAD(P)H-hydrate epimerase
MLVVTPEQMQTLDGRTIQGGTPGPVLMQRAGLGIALAMWRHIPRFGARPILILCGPGNNGGDGFVAARLFRERGLRPEVVLLGALESLRGDAPQACEKYLAAGGKVLTCLGEGDLLAVERQWSVRREAVVVDALLGTGTRGAPRGIIASGVQMIERLRSDASASVVAVDTPTGVDASSGEVPGDAVTAEMTVTMAFPKSGFFFYPGRSYVGRLIPVDIGIPEPPAGEFPLGALLGPEARSILPGRRPEAHKGDVGRVVIVGGSSGLTGAVSLAGDAAVASGSGLVTAAIPAGLNTILEVKLTEAMTFPLPETDRGYLSPESATALRESDPGWDAWALGPGLGRYPEAPELMGRLFTEVQKPVVVDADGLNALSDAEWPERHGPPAVLTPHPGEMARLVKSSVKDVCSRPIEVTLALAQERNCVVVLKGAPTLIADPLGRVSINPTGNPGMATGGMGDVLTGIIAALLGQGLSPWDAARLGVYIHGYAGDLAALERGWLSLKAGDLIEWLPLAWKDVGRPLSPLEAGLVVDRITEVASQ